ncbi:MAG: hypothetical protein KAR45_05025 [Desulfobacteraceae bacterium]|nr:hypothetical protein [Desulfobacteraceae bacterium]
MDAVKSIKIWMITNDIRARDIAKDYGCSDMFVSDFLRQRRTSNKMAQYLIDKGFPKENFKNGRVAA